MRMPFAVRLAFVVTVVAEVAGIALVGSAIGGWWTFGLILATAILGGWCVRTSGRRALETISGALREQRTEPQALAGPQALLTGGVLLLVPGFLTDIVGLLFVLPPTRALARRVFGGAVRSLRPRQQNVGRFTHGDVIDGEVVDDSTASPQPPASDGNVIEGEIVDRDDDPRNN